MKSPLSVALALALALMGCASTTQTSPACAAAKAKVVSYYTPVRRLPLAPTSTPGLVRVYRSQATTTQVSRCANLLLSQEVVLEQVPDAGALLKEIREFYAGDGTLVARQRQDVTAQLQGPGTYRNAISVPIPADAPLGHYRIVSTLQLEPPRSSVVTLGKSEVRFEIVSER